jgi:hypothetical protein
MSEGTVKWFNFAEGIRLFLQSRYHVFRERSAWHWSRAARVETPAGLREMAARARAPPRPGHAR